MNQPSPRLANLFALSILSAIAGSAACGSAPEPGDASASTDQALLDQSLAPIQLPACATNYARVCNPGTFGICPCQPEIQTATGAPDPNAPDTDCYLSAPIPVPPELEGNGCTLGVVYEDGQRLWACPAGYTPPKTIAWPAATQGYEVVVYTAAEGRLGWDSRCLGDPDPGFFWPGIGEMPGWELVDQIEASINQACSGGCPTKWE